MTLQRKDSFTFIYRVSQKYALIGKLPKFLSAEKSFAISQFAELLTNS